MENAIEAKEIETKSIDFISSVIITLIQKYDIKVDNLTGIMPSFIFTDDEHYGDEIKKINPNAEYTNEERYKAVGKFLYINEKSYLVIKSYILEVLFKTNYENPYGKFIILHELGHWLNNMLNPELRPKEKPKYPLPLKEVSKYIYDIIIDEYMANNYVSFLLSDEQCKEIIKDDELYEDIENIYTSITDKYDLFTRFWNKPNSIFNNLISSIPLYKKCGGFVMDDILEIINVKAIIALLEKGTDQLSIIYNNLIYVFNLIVKDYNSDNPEIMQKSIE
jgi:hypothetical protein